MLSWSGGKDAALAFGALADDPAVDVCELLTTVSAATGRTSMHGVRPDLIRAQASALEVSLRLVELPADASNEAYEERMAAVHESYSAEGVESVAFGDVFLEDVRAYRESNLARGPLTGRWPLWGRDTEALAREFVRDHEAVVVGVDGERLDRSFVGRPYDESFLSALPADVDPCAERGEFHTFVVDGPGFSGRVAVERGETVTREVGGTPSHYCDLRRR